MNNTNTVQRPFKVGAVIAIKPTPYRPTVRGEDWQQLSLEVRVLAGGCQCCERRLSGPAKLQAAHLVAEVELWALNLRERYLLDRRSLVALCRRCHVAFDLLVGVRRGLVEGRVRALERWRERSSAGFQRLFNLRSEWLATILIESDGREGF